MSNCRLYFNTWVRLKDRSCFPGGADTPTGGWVDRHGAGAVVQRPGHRGCTDNYEAKEKRKKEKMFIYIYIYIYISYSEATFLTWSKTGSGVGWEGVSEGAVCVLPVWIGICPPDTPAKKS